MRIKSLAIRNYRIFEGEHRIDFPKNNKPVLFIGVNGAGKTTIIEAIIGAFWEYIHKILSKRISKDERLNNQNININSNENAFVELHWEGIYNQSFYTGFEIRQIVEPEFNFIGTKKIKEYVEELKGEVGTYRMEAGIPIIVNYPVERTVLNPTLKSKKRKKENQFDSYENSFVNSIDFQSFFDWFRDKEDLENEMRLNKDSTYLDKGLNHVRDSILSFLDQFSKIRVSRELEITRLVLEKRGTEYSVNQLSHGEKAVLALVGDLARRLVIANPGSPKPLHGKGIVLIDEIDLHLHPKWQRTILQRLQNTFPNIQFICTTHSALVINHVDKESIFLLEDGNCIPLTSKYIDFNSYGADIEDILRIVQGTDELLPKDIKSELDKLFLLISQKKFDDAEQLITALKLKTDPSQPEIKKAETEIEYRKMIKS